SSVAINLKTVGWNSPRCFFFLDALMMCARNYKRCSKKSKTTRQSSENPFTQPVRSLCVRTRQELPETIHDNHKLSRMHHIDSADLDFFGKRVSETQVF